MSSCSSPGRSNDNAFPYRGVSLIRNNRRLEPYIYRRLEPYVHGLRAPCSLKLSKRFTSQASRGASLIRNNRRLEPYSRLMPRALW